MHILKNFIIIAFYLLSFSKMLAQVGINTAVPLSTLDINGNISLKTIGVPTAFFGGPSGGATPIIDGVYLSLTPTSGNIEFIIPNAVSVPGRVYFLRNISNTITAQLYSYGGMFFNKSSNTATAAPLNLSSNSAGKSIIIISDGVNWTYFD